MLGLSASVSQGLARGKPVAAGPSGVTRSGLECDGIGPLKCASLQKHADQVGSPRPCPRVSRPRRDPPTRSCVACAYRLGNRSRFCRGPGRVGPYEDRSMQEAPNRRFNLGDAMVMIAAITPGLVLIRVGVGLGLFEVGKMTETGGRPSTLARQLVEFFNVGGGCILAGLVPAVLILGLYRAQPSRRDAARGTGIVICFVAMAASILPILWFAGTVLVESRLPYPVYSVAFNNLFGRWMHRGRPYDPWGLDCPRPSVWRPNPTRTDRAGIRPGLVLRADLPLLAKSTSPSSCRLL